MNIGTYKGVDKPTREEKRKIYLESETGMGMFYFDLLMIVLCIIGSVVLYYLGSGVK